MTEGVYGDTVTGDTSGSVSILFRLTTRQWEPDEFAGVMPIAGVELTKRLYREAATFFHGKLHLGVPATTLSFAAAMKPGIKTIMSLRASSALSTSRVTRLREDAQVWFDSNWSIPKG